MALLDDILTWSRADLKPWQQDALRRLFQKTVDVSAIDDLYAMLKSNAGIEDVQRREPEPLDENHLPVTPTKDNAARLISLGDIKDVNRLLPGQVLKFSLKGLTIIYGGNGTGKSGYARILKRACRSRDVSEDIHTNAQDATRKYAIPQATFNIELEGEVLSLTWQKNRPSPKELATIAVFDTYCARAYLDQQQEVAYLPIGLDMVEGLAQIVLPKILEKLNAEIATIDTSKEAFNNLIGVTKVGNLIASLSEKTKIEDIKELAQMESTEILRMKELEKALNESDPKTKIKDLRLVIGRVSGLKVKIEKATAWVTDEFM